VAAVLDWEMATIGAPFMDLGTTLAYWVEADDPPMLRSLGLGVTALPGNLTRGAVVARYARATGRAVPDMLFYYVFGVFKVAVIAQQIFARFAKGTTHDERFTRLDRAVAALGEAGVRALDRGQIGSAR
jgi:aminoglycoside phosphotransferase (APT) family kinase protein